MAFLRARFSPVFIIVGLNLRAKRTGFVYDRFYKFNGRFLHFASLKPFLSPVSAFLCPVFGSFYYFQSKLHFESPFVDCHYFRFYFCQTVYLPNRGISVYPLGTLFNHFTSILDRFFINLSLNEEGGGWMKQNGR